MFKKCFLMFVLCIIATINAVYAASLPPDVFYVYNRAPWEKGIEIGFGYNMRTDVDIYEAPGSSHKVGCMVTGEPVQEIRSLAITHPKLYPVHLYKTINDTAFIVPEGGDSINFAKNLQKKNIIIPAGETIYLLMYVGEGCYMGWYNDYILHFVSSFNIKNFPSLNGSKPPYLGEYMGKTPVNWEYWVKYRKSDGTVGWGIHDYQKFVRDLYRFQMVKE